MFLATGEGLYGSGDAGASWDHITRRGEQMGYPDFLFFDPRDENVIYLGGARLDPGRWRTEKLSDSRIMRSNDAGESWVDLDHGLPKPVVGAFEAMMRAVASDSSINLSAEQAFEWNIANRIRRRRR